MVPVGEVENFCRDLGSHGPKFVNKLLTEVRFDDPKLAGLRAFVELVHLGSHAPLEEAASVENGDSDPETESTIQAVDA